MKQAQQLRRYLTTLFLLAVTTLTWAYDFEVNGIYYDKNTDGTSVTVTYNDTNYDSYSGSVVIPSTVTYDGKTYSITGIGNSAFRNCPGLTSVTIPESVTSIGSWAFSGCSGLTKVTIPNSVTSIGSYAFYDCSGLTSVTIPESVTSIGSGAFYETAWYNNQADGIVYINKIAYAYKGTMPSGTEIVIKDGTLGIAYYAFENCSGLTSITIPNSVTSIGSGAFYNCSGLTSIIVEKNNPKYDSRNDCNAIIETEPNTLIAGCQNTIIPNSVTSIGQSAFSDCSGLTSITIPGSVTSIGSSAFYNCYSLTSVTIGSGVTSIGDSAFYNCDDLTSVTIPNSVTSIGNYAFEYCFGLKSITIPNSVTSIGSSAFRGCYGLTSVTIPESVTSIGSHTFRDCTGLTSVTIPNSVTSIGDRAFYGCTCLTSVTIPNSVTSIGERAFFKCKGLTSVTIGSGVTSIDSEAFYKCSGLTSVTCHAQNVPSTDSDVFDGVPQSTATLYVPKESIDAYKSTSPWSSFGTILPITPTAVESLTADEASDTDKDDAIYDLQGRRLHEKPARGFYIQVGKKHFVK